MTPASPSQPSRPAAPRSPPLAGAIPQGQAIVSSTPSDRSPAPGLNSRPARPAPMPIDVSLAGPDSLSGQSTCDAQAAPAAEGSASPQAKPVPVPTIAAPAGNQHSHGQYAHDAQLGVAVAAASVPGHRPRDAHSVTAGDHACPDAQRRGVPGGQPQLDAQAGVAAGEQDQLAAIHEPAPIPAAPLADPLLALAADVLTDLEKVRIANENRLRQLTRSVEDSDGETRGFGLDETHPDVARLAALVGMLAQAEHQAVLNLQRLVRAHPLGPWVRRTVGVGEKQGARLLAAIGDPYVRPDITREDGTIEPSRPRLVSELWAYCGYHVLPAGSQRVTDTHASGAADGNSSPASQPPTGTHRMPAGGDQDGHPSHWEPVAHGSRAGVAPKRRKGQHANWSATAKMRAYLIAESCVKQRASPYRAVYDATRANYATATHGHPCERCGPKGKPAQPGTPLSDGHKHARALRAVAKKVLKDLWREARTIHASRNGDEVT